MKTFLSTTFVLLKKNEVCESGCRKLAKHLGGVKDYGKNTPINLLTVLESNGVADCVWCFCATEQEAENTFRLIACDFAESVLPIFEKEYPNDKRPREAIAISRLYAKNEATREELDAARAAARAAAWDAAWAAEEKKQAIILRKYLMEE